MELARDKLEWIEYDLLKNFPEVVQATFLRQGGYSSAPFQSLNLSHSVGDKPDAVKANRNLVQQQLQLPFILYAKQTHQTEVAIIKTGKEALPEADALITQTKGVGLAITHADCQAALFFDPATQTIAACHAGWRGLVKNIYRKTVEAMHHAFQCNPKDLLVGISPTLCVDHSEFLQYKEEFPSEFWDFQEEPFHFNLRAIAQKQLNGAGIPDRNIEFSQLCTFCEQKDCYSHRREKKTGRHATIIGLISR